MARTYNPYASQYEGAIRAAGELGQQFLKATNPAAGIEAEALGWRANRDRQSVIDSQRERGILENAYNTVRSMDPSAFGGGDAGRLFQTVIGSAAGRGDYDNLGSANLAIGGAMPEVDAGRLGRLFIGNNNAIGQEDAFGLNDREFVRGEIQDDTLQQDRQQQQADYRLGMDKQVYKTRNRLPGSLEEGAAWGAAGYRNDAMPDGPGGMSPEAYLFHRYGNVDPSGAPVDSGSGGGAGGADKPDWLDATRREKIESAADEALNLLVEDAGMEPGQVPPELRSAILENTIRRIGQAPDLAPRAVVGELWQQYDVQPQGTGWFDGAPRFEYNLPTPGAAPAQQGRLPVVVSDADYEALPPGTVFQDETGQQFRKPAE